jgi:hypothetical protein
MRVACLLCRYAALLKTFAKEDDDGDKNLEEEAPEGHKRTKLRQV